MPDGARKRYKIGDRELDTCRFRSKKVSVTPRQDEPSRCHILLSLPLQFLDQPPEGFAAHIKLPRNLPQ